MLDMKGKRYTIETIPEHNVIEHTIPEWCFAKGDLICLNI